MKDDFLFGFTRTVTLSHMKEMCSDWAFRVARLLTLEFLGSHYGTVQPKK